MTKQTSFLVASSLPDKVFQKEIYRFTFHSFYFVILASWLDQFNDLIAKGVSDSGSFNLSRVRIESNRRKTAVEFSEYKNLNNFENQCSPY